MKRSFLSIGVIVLTGIIFWPRGSATAGDAKAWATLKGRIVWGGKDIPKRQPLDQIKDNKDKEHCLSKGAILDEKWIVNEKNKGLRWTFVWLATDKGKKLRVHPDLAKIPDKPVVIDQPLCMFLPHSVGIREGQVLLVKNTSPTTHSFKYGGHPDYNPGANPSMPANTDYKIQNLKAHRIPVIMECAIHTWMKGYIRVFDHPYFAVTDENGAFAIAKAPAGKYRLVVWHGNGGWLGGAPGKDGKAVTIKGGQVNDLGSLEYPPPK